MKFKLPVAEHLFFAVEGHETLEALLLGEYLLVWVLRLDLGDNCFQLPEFVAESNVLRLNSSERRFDDPDILLNRFGRYAIARRGFTDSDITKPRSVYRRSATINEY